MPTTILTYEIINHGVEHPDYFQGCGVANTEYTDVVTGIGHSPYTAMEDALETLAAGLDFDSHFWDGELAKMPKESDLTDDPWEEDIEVQRVNECFHHVSIRVKT